MMSKNGISQYIMYNKINSILDNDHKNKRVRYD